MRKAVAIGLSGLVIYSYSGVGHSTVDGDMEAKLFINTMIAAYRTTYEPPMVEILNEEAELLKEESGNGSDPNLVYKMNWMKEYGNNLDGTKEKIRFSPSTVFK